jgi:hypothetical protein
MLHRMLAFAALSVGCFGQIALERPAAVGMPVWLKVPLDGVYFYYPFGFVVPADFGCKKVEVRRDGQILPTIANLEEQRRATGVGGYMGNGCSGKGNPPARLPLHLLYRFDQPGVYEVRYNARVTLNRQTGQREPQALAWTDWTPIEIQPGSPEARARWLTEMSAHAPTTEKELLSDFLPSIAGIPDRQSLELLKTYLHHPVQDVRQYAAAALTYWPTAER